MFKSWRTFFPWFQKNKEGKEIVQDRMHERVLKGEDANLRREDPDIKQKAS